jgi:hypothetical protein
VVLFPLCGGAAQSICGDGEGVIAFV